MSTTELTPPVPTAAGPIRVGDIPGLLPRRAREQHSAGAGGKGPRLYSWAWIALSTEDDTDVGSHHLRLFDAPLRGTRRTLARLLHWSTR